MSFCYILYTFATPLFHPLDYSDLINNAGSPPHIIILFTIQFLTNDSPRMLLHHR